MTVIKAKAKPQFIIIIIIIIIIDILQECFFLKCAHYPAVQFSV